MKRLSVFFAVLFFAFAFSAELFAGFADTHGWSTRGMARGNAMCAIVDDWSSVYYNLSGLGKTPPRPYAKGGGEEGKAKKSILEEEGDNSGGDGGSGDLRNEIGLNYLYANPTLPITFAEGSEVKTEADQNLAATGLAFAMIFDINTWYRVPEKYVSSIRFGFGMAMSGDFQMLKLNDIDLRSHNYLMYGREATAFKVLAGLGLGFMDDMFGIGIGSNIAMTGRGKMIMSGMEITPGEQSPDYQAKMDMGFDPAPAGGLYWEIGKFLKIFDIKNVWIENIKWGIAYRGETQIKIDPFEALGGTEVASIELPMTMALFEGYYPNCYIMGVAYGATIYQQIYGTLSLDYEYQQWSRNTISSCREKSFKEAGVDLPEFDDIGVYKLGLSVDIFKWLAASTGYYYQPSFIPDEANQGIFNMLDNDKHVVSFGLDFVVPPMAGMVNPVNLNLAFQYQMLTERTVNKDQELAESQAEGMGWVPYREALNPDYKYGGSVWLITFELGMKW